MRPRDLARLSSPPCDLLIVGGGIYGLATAYDAASRGLRVALVEAGDFGSGLSFNHQKTAHGGLRSLQSGRLDRASEAIRERRALARIAPRLLRPLPFLVGTYRSLLKNRLALRAAFALDEWLGRRRNEGLEPELRLPAPRLLSKAATLRLFPGIRADGLTGGAQWYDYQMVQSDRLTCAFAAAADRAGADLANYAEAVEALRSGGRIAGMRVRDRLTGQVVDVPAGLTLNAAGSRAGEVMALFGVRRPFPLLKAMNLVTSIRARDLALAAPAANGRMLTLVPWRGGSIIGTSQSTALVERGDDGVTSAEVDAFIAEANDAFPALGLDRSAITLVHRGAVPATIGRNGVPDLKSAADVLDHAADGVQGAMTVVGVKYTTARAVAERTTRAVASRLGTSVRPSRTAITMLPGAGMADHEALALEAARDAGVDAAPETLQHLAARYGEHAADIIRSLASRPELAAPLAPGVPTIGAEVVHAIRHDMACRLSDIVLRRTGLGDAGPPGAEVLAACARVAAVELGWDTATLGAEIADVERGYGLGF